MLGARAVKGSHEIQELPEVVSGLLGLGFRI